MQTLRTLRTLNALNTLNALPSAVNRAMLRTYAKAIARLQVARNDTGMSTIEYAMGSLAAAALAAVLYMVINGNGVVSAIEGIITDALSNTPS